MRTAITSALTAVMGTMDDGSHDGASVRLLEHDDGPPPPLVKVDLTQIHFRIAFNGLEDDAALLLPVLPSVDAARTRTMSQVYTYESVVHGMS
jgi:hypothetical protein